MKELIFGVVGGLAIFIYGMDLMSEGLKKWPANAYGRFSKPSRKPPHWGCCRHHCYRNYSE